MFGFYKQRAKDGEKKKAAKVENRKFIEDELYIWLTQHVFRKLRLHVLGELKEITLNTGADRKFMAEIFLRHL